MWLWGIAIWVALGALAVALYVVGAWRFELAQPAEKPIFTARIIPFTPRKPIRK